MNICIFPHNLEERQELDNQVSRKNPNLKTEGPSIRPQQMKKLKVRTNVYKIENPEPGVSDR